jgi:hypothetical protein
VKISAPIKVTVETKLRRSAKSKCMRSLQEHSLNRWIVKALKRVRLDETLARS